MSYFDFLIDAGAKPKQGIEYVYLHNLLWRVGDGLNSTPTVECRVIVDLEQQENGSYTFTLKDTGEKCRCNYGWAFAENTSYNLALYAETKRLRKT